MALLVLTTETRAAILDNLQVKDLVELSNWRVSPRLDNTVEGDIDWDVIARWATRCIAWFVNRGYVVGQEDDLVRDNVALFRPAARLSAAEQKARTLLGTDHPIVRRASPSSTSVPVGAEGDRRNFSDDQLAALDNIAEDEPGLGKQARGLI